jgi:hypothetical protein
MKSKEFQFVTPNGEKKCRYFWWFGFFCFILVNQIRKTNQNEQTPEPYH